MNLFICVCILIHCSLYCFFNSILLYARTEGTFQFFIEFVPSFITHQVVCLNRFKPQVSMWKTSVSATLTVCGPDRRSSTCSMHAGVAPAEAAFAVCTDLSHTLSSYPPLSSACQCLHQAYHKFQPTSHWGPPSLTPHHHHRGPSPHPGLPAHFPPLSSSNPPLSRRDWGKDTQVASHP